MLLLGSKRARNEVRQWLALAQDVRDFALSIVDAIAGNSPERAREILETRIREQAAGRARHQASRMAGPNRGKVDRMLDYREEEVPREVTGRIVEP